MPGKKLTPEEKEAFFHRILELEKDVYWKRRLMKQWHEGRIKIYKKRGKICFESPAEVELFVSAETGVQVFHHSDPNKPLTKEERKKYDEKPPSAEGEGKLVFLDDARERNI